MGSMCPVCATEVNGTAPGRVRAFAGASQCGPPGGATSAAAAVPDIMRPASAATACVGQRSKK